MTVCVGMSTTRFEAFARRARGSPFGRDGGHQTARPSREQVNGSVSLMVASTVPA
jgi:hypothetical protein